MRTVPTKRYNPHFLILILGNILHNDGYIHLLLIYLIPLITFSASSTEYTTTHIIPEILYPIILIITCPPSQVTKIMSIIKNDIKALTPPSVLVSEMSVPSTK